ncbi:rod-binding protein [Maridesulfovibrio salexigens]|uniref:Membrane protein, metalloendopeptidase-like protein n=1 Tax=Maridesulfovibrio salexigens (strain ATCC 14822 / DSM 2638 / NCIMB 8403 / VKM B-1763) TaxID=526222 RepID=C6C0E5_MARSD|nr:rod-binding protein [Maridesulfovibrio salexigens]ACS79079.1 membrane protein, metalloendopeptidase-like protein [Maridesulfovibrio salexigens DSM 2638]
MIDSTMNTATAQANAESKELQGFKRKLTSLNDRLSGGKDQEAALRDACKKFEAVFMGKIWQQMRKNVPKGGYLTNRYEQQYTSMFDKDFSEKLAEGGGIGLGDMLYDQLRAKLENASKSTLPGTGNSTALKTLDEVGRKGSVHGTRLASINKGENDGLPGIPLPKPGIPLEDDDFSMGQRVERQIARENSSNSAAPSPMSRTEAMAKIEELARKIEQEHDTKVYVQGVTAEEIGKKLAGI